MRSNIEHDNQEAHGNIEISQSDDMTPPKSAGTVEQVLNRAFREAAGDLERQIDDLTASLKEIRESNKEMREKMRAMKESNARLFEKLAQGEIDRQKIRAQMEADESESDEEDYDVEAELNKKDERIAELEEENLNLKSQLHSLFAIFLLFINQIKSIGNNLNSFFSTPQGKLSDSANYDKENKPNI